jgi:hypothetical protein
MEDRRLCIQIVSERLTEGVLSPFNSIMELQHYASSLAAVEPRPPNVSLSDDVQTISVGGVPLSLATWRAGLKKVAASIHSRFKKVFRGLEIKYHIPTDLVDDMNDTTAGMGWLDGGKFTEEDNPLMKHYLDGAHSDLAYLGPDGRFYFHIEPALDLMRDFTFINQRLCILNAQVNSESTRATSHIDTRIRNGMRRRNHGRDGGRHRNVIQQSKNSHNRHMDVYIPILIASDVQVIEEIYLIYIRPVEEAIAMSLWGNGSRMLYREFMYVQMGLRLTSSKYYKHFPQSFKEYFGVEFSVLDYRHWAVTVMREFIEQRHHIVQNGNTIGDKIADHSTSLSRRVYSQKVTDLPYQTADFTWWCDQFCRRWQDLSGFSGNKPPLPIRILDMIQSSTPVSLIPADVPSDVALTGFTPQANGGLVNRMETLEMQLKESKAAMSASMEMLRCNVREDMKTLLAEGLSAVMSSVGREPSNASDSSSAVVARSAFSDQDMTPHVALPPVTRSKPARNVAVHVPPEAEAEGSTRRSTQAPPSNHRRTEYAVSDDIDPELEADAKAALRRALGDDRADWKSEEQRKTVMYSLDNSKHLVSVMNTGEGKSMTWVICSLLQSVVSVVVVPFHTLLTQHLDNARRMGCKAMQWTTDMTSLCGNNLIFMAMETAASKDMER